jgi:Ran GTPase-activating protein (RanGAP) involved in mRNA processing and transport
VNTGKLGLKHLNLNKNLLGTKSALAIAQVLKNDEYLRAISMKKNKIGEEGIKEMFSVC